jgi:NO-binding membrane sensor protein with MHYT domain
MKGSFNLVLVALSYAVSVFGSYVGLALVSKITNLRNTLDRVCLVGAAIALGGGAIWSMHFIGMLAYQSPMPVAYDPNLTIISMVVAILFTGIGAYLVIRQKQLRLVTLVGAGVVMGLGVAAMHYTGMSAVQMAGTMHNDPTIVALSVVIAIVASTAALWIAFHVRTTALKIVSAFVMGAAVCGMHYTAMFGMTMTHDAKAAPVPTATMVASDLAVYVALSAVSLLILTLLVSFAKELQMWDKSG